MRVVQSGKNGLRITFKGLEGRGCVRLPRSPWNRITKAYMNHFFEPSEIDVEYHKKLITRFYVHGVRRAFKAFQDHYLAHVCGVISACMFIKHPDCFVSDKVMYNESDGNRPVIDSYPEFDLCVVKKTKLSTLKKIVHIWDDCKGFSFIYELFPKYLKFRK